MLGGTELLVYQYNAVHGVYLSVAGWHVVFWSDGMAVASASEFQVSKEVLCRWEWWQGLVRRANPLPFVDDCSLRIATWVVSYQGLACLPDILWGGQPGTSTNSEERKQEYRSGLGAKGSSGTLLRTMGGVYGVITDFD